MRFGILSAAHVRALRRGVAAAALALFGFLPSAASAHPHVWVVVKSRIEFAPDGKIKAIVHDWTFDEMYSSFATEGLAPKGQLVGREIFAPLAKQNAGGLADLGYFTTLKIGGKPVEFGEVSDYWMEERPDHLVAFHVVMPLKAPTAPGKFSSLLVADPEYFIDFGFDDHDAVSLGDAPKGCSIGITKPAALAGDDKKKLDESVFTNMSPGAGFGFKMAPRAMLACP